jgi:hypothetical protein
MFLIISVPNGQKYFSANLNLEPIQKSEGPQKSAMNFDFIYPKSGGITAESFFIFSCSLVQYQKKLRPVHMFNGYITVSRFFFSG